MGRLAKSLTIIGVATGLVLGLVWVLLPSDPNYHAGVATGQSVSLAGRSAETLDDPGEGRRLLPPSAMDEDPEHAQVQVNGTVTDEVGEPVADVELGTWRNGEYGDMVRSDAEGKFKLRVLETATDAVYLRVTDPGRCSVIPMQGPLDFESGTVEVVLPLSFSVDIVVRDMNGMPVEDYAVCARSCKNQTKGSDAKRLGGHHEGGKLTVDDLWSGENVLVVVPSDPGLMMSDVHRFVVASVTEPLEIRLTAKSWLTVMVQDSQGEVVENGTVQIVSTKGQALRVGKFVADRRDDPLSAVTSFLGRLPTLFDEGATDVQGHVRLQRPVGRFGVIVRRDGYDDSVLGEPEPLGDRLLVVVPAGGRLELVVLGTIPPTWKVNYAAWPKPSRGPHQAAAPRHESGNVYENLKPGIWEAGFEMVEVEGFGVVPLSHFKTVRIRSGFTERLVIDMSEVRSGSFEGQVFINGRPATGKATVWCTGQWYGNRGKRTFVLEADGWFQMTSMPQRPYLLKLDPDEAAGRSQVITCPELSFEIRGERDTKRFDLSFYPLELRLIDGEGTPVSNQKINVSPGWEQSPGPKLGGGFQEHQSGKDGRVTIGYPPWSSSGSVVVGVKGGVFVESPRLINKSDTDAHRIIDVVIKKIAR